MGLQKENKLLKLLKDYSSHITSLGGFLVIFSLLGFNVDIPKFYNSLEIEARILLIFSINLIFTIVIAVLLLNEIHKDKVKELNEKYPIISF